MMTIMILSLVCVYAFAYLVVYIVEKTDKLDG